MSPERTEKGKAPKASPVPKSWVFSFSSSFKGMSPEWTEKGKAPKASPVPNFMGADGDHLHVVAPGN